jgi:hypothetical protein
VKHSAPRLGDPGPRLFGADGQGVHGREAQRPRVARAATNGSSEPAAAADDHHGAARDSGVGARLPSGGRARRRDPSGSDRTTSDTAQRWLGAGFGRQRVAVRARHSASTRRPLATPRGGGERVWTPRSLRPWCPSQGLLGGSGEDAAARPTGARELAPGSWRDRVEVKVTSRATAARPRPPFGVAPVCTARARRTALPSGWAGRKGCPASAAGSQARRAPASSGATEPRWFEAFANTGDPLSAVGAGLRAATEKWRAARRRKWGWSSGHTSKSGQSSREEASVDSHGPSGQSSGGKPWSRRTARGER